MMEYFSDEAYELCVWSYETLRSDRPKAIRIKRMTHAVEERYRENNNDIIQSIRQRRRIGWDYVCPKKESMAKLEAIRNEIDNEPTTYTI